MRINLNVTDEEIDAFAAVVSMYGDTIDNDLGGVESTYATADGLLTRITRATPMDVNPPGHPRTVDS